MTTRLPRVNESEVPDVSAEHPRPSRYLVLIQQCERRGVSCLPLHRQLADRIRAENRTPPRSGSTGPMVVAAGRHLLLHEDWDTISAKQGFLLRTDHVHLNATAAAVVADLLTDALTTR